MRAYRAWLHLYPASFRAEYGEEMCAIFARRRREGSGPFAWIALWVSVCGEVLFNAAAVHWDILRQDLRYIVSMVLCQGVWLALAGVVTLRTALEPGDAVTFGAVAGLCVVMTLAGSLLPALRALWIDPVRAIRSE